MIYVTHDQMEALALADRVAVMSNAELQQVGTRAELYDHPVSKFVADFIGEPPTNFTDARVATTGHLTVGHSDAFTLVPDEARLRALETQGLGEAIVGIRPQNLFTSFRPGADNSFEVTVDVSEYLGETSIVTARAGGHTLRAIAPPDLSAKNGDKLRLFYRRGDIMLFHPETELFLG